MGTPNLTKRDEAEIVKMFLPDHTLDRHGKVVPVSLCPLCGKALDWTTTDTIEVDGKMVKVHQICPREDRD